ncbi:MAG: biotin/lipoyl-binding protein, partial [Bacteroidales bacterium]|nr:biotin/lipoyl-binding protein [Bacteroidales bacterium]
MGAGKKKRRWWLLFALVLAAAVIISQFGKHGPERVEVQHPALGSITQSASAFGRIRAVDQVKISPDVSGEITELYFDEGDSVKRGDLLLKIRQD